MADYRNSGILNADGTVNIGLSHNNPGDIKDDGTPWQGKIGSDGTFLIFADTTWGLRAIGVDLTTKINRDGLNTITEIVGAYAPASDGNDVGAYIAAVSSDTGFDPNQVLTPDVATLSALIRAIVNHEIGDSLSGQYVSDADIAQGLSMMNSVSATATAAVIAAQANPILAALVIAGGAFILAKILK
jgi:hypothetical protein